MCIRDRLYESKNVETYKFIIDNAIENGCINVTYYIDDKAVKTNYNAVSYTHLDVYKRQI